MSNVRSAPAWVNAYASAMAQADADRVKARHAMTSLGLTADEIAQVERIAAVTTRMPGEVVADFVRASISAIEAGGWRVPGAA